jgi:site-specific recombinase XerD
LTSIVTLCVRGKVGGKQPWRSRNLAVVLFLVTTGVNEDEFLNVRVRQVTEIGSPAKITISNKSGQERCVPVPEETMDLLRRYLLERRGLIGVAQNDDVLFVRANGEPFSARALYRLVARLLAQAGVEPRTGSMVHLLRRTYVARAKSSGKSIQELHELLGHESKRSTQRLLATV